MQLKKILAILIAALLLLSFGCKKKDETPAPAEAATPTEAPAPVDTSFTITAANTAIIRPKS